MPDTPPPIGPYTPIVEAGDFLICSGQLGVTNGVLAEGLAAQTAVAIANLSKLLEGVGASLSDVVKTTVFVLDMAEFATMNAAYVEAFAEHRPARSAVAVQALPLGGLVEVEAWALRPAR